VRARGSSARHLIVDGADPEPGALRALAAWYRKYAERTENPVVWHARVTTAEILEHEATRLQERADCSAVSVSPAVAASAGNGTKPDA
jgi:hypothetical protein